MRILLIEPYFTGSHSLWAEGYARNSRHDVDILSLEGRYWKWRMHGGAITLAKSFLERKIDPDLILATDMLDLTTFLTLTRRRSTGIPVVVYFHENQISYPWSPEDRDILHKRDKHYGFINYSTVLAADAVCFNSAYHKNSFLEELSRLLKHFPDHRNMENIQAVADKSRVLYVGVDFSLLERHQPLRRSARKQSGAPVILWNHRWEYDKNPDDFFNALEVADAQDLEFQVVILGENFKEQPSIFVDAQKKLGDKIIHCGYVENYADYADWLYKADILPVTSIQDFFGISVVEAIFCGCFPLLPLRLSYPELLPIESCRQNYYENFGELVKKLIWAVSNIDAVRQTVFREYIERFSWKQMAPLYDDFFETLV